MRTSICKHYRRPGETCADCDTRPSWMPEMFSLIAVGALVAVVGTLVIAMEMVNTDEIPADNAQRIVRQETEYEKEARQLAETREYVISEIATGYTRLGLEYDITIDQDALKEMLVESSFLADESDLTGAQWGGWVSSPADLAAGFKESWLDDGKSPTTELQKWADRTEKWQARTR